MACDMVTSGSKTERPTEIVNVTATPVRESRLKSLDVRLFADMKKHALANAHSGNLNANSSPEYAPPLTASTMYCLPFNMYVIGAPLSCAGM
jgi:hypothetical protein